MVDLLDLEKSKHFPDLEVQQQNHRYLPKSKHPVYKVFCHYEEFALIQEAAPKSEDVRFLFPPDLGVRKVPKKRNLAKKGEIQRIRDVILQVENEPNVMFSRDLLADLGGYAKIAPAELQDMSKSLDQFLENYTVSKCGVHMGDRTKTFLKNELIYLILRFKGNTT